MTIKNANAIFIEDDEGVVAITDISEKKVMSIGEFVYDGKNVGIFNRDNEKYYALQNIPLSMRENIVKSKEITLIERDAKEGISAYSIAVKVVNDMGLPDMWEEYSQNVIKDLQDLLTAEDFNKLIAK